MTTPIQGFYDLAGEVAEVAEVSGELLLRFQGIPDSYAPRLRPVGEDSYSVSGGTLTGMVIAFDAEGGLVGGVIPLRRCPPPGPSPWPNGRGLVLRGQDPEEAELIAFESLWAQTRLTAGGVDLEWTLPWPKHHFVDWLSRRQEVIFHGSPLADIEVFIPRRTSVELFDLGGKGNRGAVYGTPYGLWSMWFAVIDRSRLKGSIRNGVTRFTDSEARHLDVYMFSVHHEFVGKPIWRTGTLYILPRQTFTPLPFYPGGPPSNEWASTEEVRPIARLTVEPADFLFLDEVGGHDDSDLIESDRLSDIVTEHVREVVRRPTGISLRLDWDETMASNIDRYLDSRRRFTPDVERGLRVDDGQYWLDVSGPDGYLQAMEASLARRGLTVEGLPRNP